MKSRRGSLTRANFELLTKNFKGSFPPPTGIGLKTFGSQNVGIIFSLVMVQETSQINTQYLSGIIMKQLVNISKACIGPSQTSMIEIL